MKILKLDIDYPKNEREVRGADGQMRHLSSQDVTINTIVFVITDTYSVSSGRGMTQVGSMDRHQIKMWGKLLEKLDEKVREVEMSDEQFDFLYEAITNYKKWPPAFGRVAPKLIEALEDARAGKGEAEKPNN